MRSIQAHKCELKVKSTCSNEEERYLIQVGSETIHEQVINTKFSKDLLWPRLEKSHYFPPLQYTFN